MRRRMMKYGDLKFSGVTENGGVDSPGMLHLRDGRGHVLDICVPAKIGLDSLLKEWSDSGVREEKEGREWSYSVPLGVFDSSFKILSTEGSRARREGAANFKLEKVVSMAGDGERRRGDSNDLRYGALEVLETIFERGHWDITVIRLFLLLLGVLLHNVDDRVRVKLGQ